MGIMEIEVELIEPGGMKRVSCVSCLAMMTHALEKLRTYKKVSLGTK